MADLHATWWFLLLLRAVGLRLKRWGDALLATAQASADTHGARALWPDTPPAAPPDWVARTMRMPPPDWLARVANQAPPDRRPPAAPRLRRALALPAGAVRALLGAGAGQRALAPMAPRTHDAPGPAPQSDSAGHPAFPSTWRASSAHGAQFEGRARTLHAEAGSWPVRHAAAPPQSVARMMKAPPQSAARMMKTASRTPAQDAPASARAAPARAVPVHAMPPAPVARPAHPAPRTTAAARAAPLSANVPPRAEPASASASAAFVQGHRVELIAADAGTRPAFARHTGQAAPDGPWPPLPAWPGEAQAEADADAESMALREQEHVRRIDVEQRGKGWNG